MLRSRAIDPPLMDIVTEYNIDEMKHIDGWRGRHPVILTYPLISNDLEKSAERPAL